MDAKSCAKRSNKILAWPVCSSPDFHRAILSCRPISQELCNTWRNHSQPTILVAFSPKHLSVAKRSPKRNPETACTTGVHAYIQAPSRIAGWSSPVARQAHNLKAVGSNPTPATNFQKRLLSVFCFFQTVFRWVSSNRLRDRRPPARHMRKAYAVLLTFGLVLSTIAQERSGWAIHEWGTFTSLQDEQGNALGGINTDDEPVPGFVHRLSHWILQLPTESPPMFFQGAPKCHPDVTMRLETPVIYFHPPTAPKQIHEANVSVKFRGGWLTEFYPKADPHVAGLDLGTFNFGPLNSDSVSELTWNNLKIGGDWPITNTTEYVWTSPRAVNAALVQTSNHEAEKF